MSTCHIYGWYIILKSAGDDVGGVSGREWGVGGKTNGPLSSPLHPEPSTAGCSSYE